MPKSFIARLRLNNSLGTVVANTSVITINTGSGSIVPEDFTDLALEGNVVANARRYGFFTKVVASPTATTTTTTQAPVVYSPDISPTNNKFGQYYHGLFRTSANIKVYNGPPGASIRAYRVQSTSPVTTFAANVGVVGDFTLDSQGNAVIYNETFSMIGYYTYHVAFMNYTGIVSTEPYRTRTIKTFSPRGEVVYTTAGTYSWTVPEGVFSICAVAVGGGGGSAGLVGGNGPGSSGGGGGALSYKNNWPVTPGQILTLVVGARGLVVAGTGQSGGNSTISDGFGNIMIAGGGSGGVSGSLVKTLGGQSSGYRDGGGSGGQGGAGGPDDNDSGRPGGGGGAGGYSGKGGDGGQATSRFGFPDQFIGIDGENGQGGAGGGGGGGNGTHEYSAGGGGVGLFGQGTSGLGGTTSKTSSTPLPVRGEPGSAGIVSSLIAVGGSYGGGGGGSGGVVGGAGGTGAIRIIWGLDRSFPFNAA